MWNQVKITLSHDTAQLTHVYIHIHIYIYYQLGKLTVIPGFSPVVQYPSFPYVYKTGSTGVIWLYVENRVQNWVLQLCILYTWFILILCQATVIGWIATVTKISVEYLEDPLPTEPLVARCRSLDMTAGAMAHQNAWTRKKVGLGPPDIEDGTDFKFFLFWL